MPKTPPSTPPTDLLEVTENVHAPGVGIHNAILAIYKENQLYAQKASRNTAQGYNYTSEADFLALIRPQLAAHGVVCHPQYKVTSEWELTTKSGATMKGVTIEGTFRFIHAPSSTGLSVTTLGQGVDQQDKAVYKAMTGALKYAVRQLFMIETGDDPEADEKPEAPAPPPAPKRNFEEDLKAEFNRLGSDKYLKALKAALPNVANGDDLTLLPPADKKHLITQLRATPAF